MVKRSVCFILTFVMIVCSLLTDNSVYAASKLTTLKVDKVYKQFDLDHDGKNEELLFKEHEVPEWEEDMCDYLSVYVNGKKILNVKGIYYKEQYSILLVQMQKKYFLYVNLWGDDGVGPIVKETIGVGVNEKAVLRFYQTALSFTSISIFPW